MPRSSERPNEKSLLSHMGRQALRFRRWAHRIESFSVAQCSPNSLFGTWDNKAGNEQPRYPHTPRCGFCFRKSGNVPIAFHDVYRYPSFPPVHPFSASGVRISWCCIWQRLNTVSARAQLFGIQSKTAHGAKTAQWLRTMYPTGSSSLPSLYSMHRGRGNARQPQPRPQASKSAF